MVQCLKHVPLICNRKVIIKGYHENPQYIGAQAFSISSRDELLWPNVSEDCIFVVACCNGCYIENTRFVAKPYLKPTDKPRACLKGWSIN